MSEERRQAVAGVAPPDVSETVIMQVWPSISASSLGRTLGQLYSIPLAGRLIALATFPLAILLYFLPGRLFRRYTLTTRRVLIETGPRPRPAQTIDLEDIAEVQVRGLPGQAYYRASDLLLKTNGTTSLELPGVPAPESFRHAILNARDAYVMVREARRAQEVEREPASKPAEATA
jgi:hypothetical protein